MSVVCRRTTPILLVVLGLLVWSAAPVSATPHATSPPAANEIGTGRAVSADSPTDAWLIQDCYGIQGCHDNSNSPALVHWDGSSWTEVASFFDQSLFSVDALTPTNAWVAGVNDDAPGGPDIVIKHWDGAAWTDSPISGPLTQSTLFGVTADSATDAWAVGYRTVGTRVETLILHGNGSSWTPVPSPSPGTDSYELTSVSAVSPTDAWAVGNSWDAALHYRTVTLHWDGTRWSYVSSPNSTTGYTYLNGVSATTSGAWAVGAAGNAQPSSSAFVLRWNGSRWSKVASPNPGASFTYLTAVSAVGSSGAWLAGWYCNNTYCEGTSCTQSDCGAAESLIERWNGHAWTQVHSPDPSASFNTLAGLATDGASDAWAVGENQGPRANKTLIAHWNGTRWTHIWPG